MEGLASSKELKTSTSSSSGCSTSSSTTDIKKYHHNIKLSNTTRSRSFFHCLSKRLGKHFLQHSSLSTSLTSSSSDNHGQHHHHHHHSQEDLRSSSTDSFSLSYERNSRSDCEATNLRSHCDRGISAENVDFNFSTDLSGNGKGTSRSLSASAYSSHNHENENFYNTADMYRYSQRHFYLDTNLHTRSSTLHCGNVEEDLSETDSGNSSSNSDEADKQESYHYHHQQSQSQSQNQKTIKKHLPLYNGLQEYPLADSHSRSKSDGFHLRRISITSSVRSILQYFSTSQISTLRSSHSCDSTPSKRAWNLKCKTNTSNTHHISNSDSSNSNNSNNNVKFHVSAINSASKSTPNSKPAATPTTAKTKNNKKKTEKKQHSILRPPINYVHMKGLSGLYSRVPRYTVCCPYGTQQKTYT